MWLTSNPGDIASRKRVGGIENQGKINTRQLTPTTADEFVAYSRQVTPTGADEFATYYLRYHHVECVRMVFLHFWGIVRGIRGQEYLQNISVYVVIYLG